MSEANTNFQMTVGKKSAITNGYRVIANDTSTGRPWMWYSPDLEMAKLLAKTLCEQIDQDVTICKMVGVMRRALPPVEFEEAKHTGAEAPASPEI